MPKKCIICEKDAEFNVKDSSEFYCQECAEDNFADMSYLEKVQAVEEQANLLKQRIDEEWNKDVGEKVEDDADEALVVFEEPEKEETTVDAKVNPKKFNDKDYYEEVFGEEGVEEKVSKTKRTEEE